MRIKWNQMEVWWDVNTMSAFVRYMADDWVRRLSVSSRGFSITRGYLHSHDQKISIHNGPMHYVADIEITGLADILHTYRTLAMTPSNDQSGVDLLLADHSNVSKPHKQIRRIMTNMWQHPVVYRVDSDWRVPLTKALECVLVKNVAPWLEFSRKSCMHRLLDLPHIPKRKNFVHSIFGCRNLLTVVVHFLYPTIDPSLENSLF
jgi:hypothetical protein